MRGDVPDLTIILIGGGGHARVVLSALGASDRIGLLDPALAVRSRVGEAVVLGGDEVLATRPEPAHVAIGDNARRREVVTRLGPRAWQAVVSPHALVIGAGDIGEGAFVGARAVLQPGVQIGRHVIVNTGAILEHDCLVGDFVHIAPGAVVCGGVRIGDDAFIGAASVIVPGVTVGKRATVGAGAVVIRDVPDGVTVVGNPARLLER